MFFNKRNTGIILAGLAAFGLYRFNKMSDAKKKELKDKLKAKSKNLYDEFMPTAVKHWLHKQQVNGSTPADTPLYNF